MAVVISDQLLDRSDRLLDAEPDAQLVGLAQTGHHAAFAAIVRRYERELLGQARRLSSDGRAEDAVQQVFLNAFAALQAGGEVRHLRGWLHQILRNVVARARVPADAPLDDVASHGETLEETVALRAQAHATLVELSALPDRQRDALLGTAVQGFPRSAVAQRMGLSEGAVRQLVHRARLRLRQAATALVPIPLGRWFGLVRSAGGATGSEAVLGAGTAASGGLAIKVGTLVASGVVATGLAVTHTFPGQRHHSAAAPRAGAAARHRAAPARTIRGLTEAPAIGSTGTPVISAAPSALPVRRSVNGRRGGASPAGHAGLHETEPGSGRARDDGPGHDSGARGQQGSGESGQSGRGGDGARGSKGDDGGRAGSGATSGRQSGSGSGSTSSGGASSGRDGASGGGSGSDSGSSGDGGSVSSGGSGSTVETGDTVASGGSGGTDGSGGSDGSGGGSGSVTTTSGSGTSGSGTSGSGSDGGQKDSGGSRDLSGSQVSSSS